MDSSTARQIEAAERSLSASFSRIAAIALHNQEKVLQALQRVRLADWFFKGSTGYGYDDIGREALEEAFALIFGSAAAIVRPHFVSGTHAIGTAILGNLQPGEELISVCGTPYDSLLSLIGKSDAPGTLLGSGMFYQEIALCSDGTLDYPAIAQAISSRTRMCLVQRSRGYSWRKPLSIEQIEEFAIYCRREHPGVIVMVDNCYGEFVAEREPPQVGAHLCAGSLIKNPGGGLAAAGGYVAGEADLVQRAAERLTMPGIAAKQGAVSGDQLRLIYQGLFLAPHTVAQALQGMQLFAAVLAALGYEVSPRATEISGDIILAIAMQSRQELLQFAAAIQAMAPVGSFLSPEPADLPGYADAVVMAGGGFVQGGSLELSLDAPLREPYITYLQGGLTYEHCKLALAKVAESIGKTL